MLNEQRIRVMTDVERYREGPGQKELDICKYYRGDYIGVALVKNFFLVSIGYVVLLIFAAAYFLEYLVENMHSVNLGVLLVEVVLGYLIVLVLYTGITYVICSIRYEKAKQRVDTYYKKLGEIEKMYITEKVKNEMLQGSRRRRP